MNARILNALAALDPDTRLCILHAARSNRPTPVLIGELQAAQLLGVSRSCLCNWRNDGVDSNGTPFPIPFTICRPTATILRYDRLELATYLDHHKTPPPA